MSPSARERARNGRDLIRLKGYTRLRLGMTLQQHNRVSFSLHVSTPSVFYVCVRQLASVTSSAEKTSFTLCSIINPTKGLYSLWLLQFYTISVYPARETIS